MFDKKKKEITMFFCSGSWLQRQHVQESSPYSAPGTGSPDIDDLTWICFRGEPQTPPQGAGQEFLSADASSVFAGSFYPAAPPQTCEPLVNATFNLLITAFALWYEDRSLNWQRSLRAELHAVQGQLGLFQLCQGGRVSPSLRPPIDEGITFSI